MKRLHNRQIFFSFVTFVLMIILFVSIYNEYKATKWTLLTLEQMRNSRHSSQDVQEMKQNSCLTISIDSLVHISRPFHTFQVDFGSNKIPKVVHYTYKNHYLPKQYELLVKECIELNPTVPFLLWTDEAAMEFVQRKDQIYKTNYHKILSTYSGIEKSDILRLLIMYYLGGIYMDLDTKCQLSFQDGLQRLTAQNKKRANHRVTCWLDQEQFIQTQIMWNKTYSAMNNLMLCRRKHPFFRFMIENLDVDDQKSFILDKTGPFLITKRYEQYMRKWSKKRLIQNAVGLADPTWFSPLVDDIHFLSLTCNESIRNNTYGDWMHGACNGSIQEYQRIEKYLETNAVLVHQFLHLGYDLYKNLITSLFDVCNYFVIIPTIVD